MFQQIFHKKFFLSFFILFFNQLSSQALFFEYLRALCEFEFLDEFETETLNRNGGRTIFRRKNERIFSENLKNYLKEFLDFSEAYFAETGKSEICYKEKSAFSDFLKDKMFKTFQEKEAKVDFDFFKKDEISLDQEEGFLRFSDKVKKFCVLKAKKKHSDRELFSLAELCGLKKFKDSNNLVFKSKNIKEKGFIAKISIFSSAKARVKNSRILRARASELFFVPYKWIETEKETLEEIVFQKRVQGKTLHRFCQKMQLSYEKLSFLTGLFNDFINKKVLKGFNDKSLSNFMLSQDLFLKLKFLEKKEALKLFFQNLEGNISIIDTEKP